MLRPTRNLLQLVARLSICCMLLGGASNASAQSANGTLAPRSVHPLLNGDLPPGALGARAAGTLAGQGYYQPAEVVVPEGAEISLATPQGFSEPTAHSMTAGLLVGAVYRFQVTNIPYRPGVELFPTVEIIDRLYPPPGLATRFPIPIHIDSEDLLNALEGRMVTRVIYLEDPQTALPLADEPGTQRILEVRPHMDPFAEADRLGRPVAILRIGSRVPPTQPEQLTAFLMGSPPWLAIAQPQEPAPVDPVIRAAQ